MKAGYCFLGKPRLLLSALLNMREFRFGSQQCNEDVNVVNCKDNAVLNANASERLRRLSTLVLSFAYLCMVSFLFTFFVSVSSCCYCKSCALVQWFPNLFEPLPKSR